ncbi:MAG TPA: flagellar biosynthesis anti-sigma factor FlgM [Bacillaceae bacterium]
MKVNPFKPTDMNPYNRNVNKTGQQPKAARADKVEISSAAKEMQQISHVEKERRARVDELKQQVQSGQYKMDPKEIAKSIAKFYTRP